MTSKETINWVRENVMESINENNLELFDIEYVKEGPNYYLRIFIDKEGGINISDCEIVTRFINEKLDEYDPIKTAYILEVSSPGIDRPLKKEEDYIKYIGHIVDIKLYKTQNNEKELTGTLQSYKDSIVTINIDNEILEIELKNIATCRLAVIF